jgi:microcompartment protein CcmL/EutN
MPPRPRSGSGPAAGPPDSIALLEIGSIAQGYAVADSLVKTAAVRLLEVEPVTPGKLLILYAGSVAELETAHAVGTRLAGEDLIDQLLLPRVHPDVLGALRAPGGPVGEAVGILECSTVAAGILAADRAAKTAAASLLEIHAARGIGGKTTILMTGMVADVEAALEAGAGVAEARAALVRKVLIPGAHPDFAASLGARWKGGAS